MREPIKHLINRPDLLPGRQAWTADHDDGQSKRTRRRYFGIGANAARIFRHDHLNFVGLHQGKIIRFAERTPSNNYFGLRQRQRRIWWINQPQKVTMLRVGCELRQMHAPNCQHDICTWPIQRRSGARNIRHIDPVVADLALPCWTGQRQMRHAQSGAGRNRIGTHLCRKRMSGVDQMGDLLGLQIPYQPIDTTKPSHPLRQGLPYRASDAACKRHSAAYSSLSQSARKRRRLGRPSEQKEVWRHG